MENKDKLQIIEEYNGLINKYVGMYFRSIKGNDVSKDDLKQEIILGLLNDLDKLDESKGKSVFIEKSIENNCLSYITTRNRMKRGNGLADDSLDKKIINIIEQMRDTFKVLLGYREVGIKPPEARFLSSCQAS